MSGIAQDADDWVAEMHRRAEEYAKQKVYVEEQKPYWLYWPAPGDGAAGYATFQYFPEWHYREAVHQVGPPLAPDGGRDILHNGKQRAQVFYWLDPETGAALYHTGAYDDEANPFFGTAADAEAFLDRQAEAADEPNRYEALSLYKARTRKVEDATEVLTDQAGIDEFMPDGGLQIDAPDRDRIWFWYNPSLDSIVQEEVGPYDVRGVFTTEDDAYGFLEWYAEQYGVVDTSHLELYSAALELEGYGRNFLEEECMDEEPPEQSSFDTFREQQGHE